MATKFNTIHENVMEESKSFEVNVKKNSKPNKIRFNSSSFDINSDDSENRKRLSDKRRQSKFANDLKLNQIYRSSLEKNFKNVRKDREVKEWATKPFELECLTESKQSNEANLTKYDYLRSLYAELDEDIGFHKDINLKDYDDQFEQFKFSRRHANYGSCGKNITEMRKFLNAKMLESNLNELSKERYFQLRKIDTERISFVQKRLAKSNYLPTVKYKIKKLF